MLGRQVAYILTGNMANTSNNPSISSSVLSCDGFDRHVSTQSSVPLDPCEGECSILYKCMLWNENIFCKWLNNLHCSIIAQ